MNLTRRYHLKGVISPIIRLLPRQSADDSERAENQSAYKKAAISTALFVLQL